MPPVWVPVVVGVVSLLVAAVILSLALYVIFGVPLDDATTFISEDD